MSDQLYAAWYVTVFLSLIIMFILMAIYENYCVKPRQRRPSADIPPQPIYNEKPPSPSPSYSKFAPPSYKEAVSKMDTKVYLVSSNYEVFFPYQTDTVAIEGSSVSTSSVFPEVHLPNRPTIAAQTSITVEILQEAKR